VHDGDQLKITSTRGGAQQSATATLQRTES
jgi:hypothetical protein